MLASPLDRSPATRAFLLRAALLELALPARPTATSSSSGAATAAGAAAAAGRPCGGSVSLAMTRVRAVFEAAVALFGSHDVDLWVRYVCAERAHGDAAVAAALQWRAEKALCGGATSGNGAGTGHAAGGGEDGPAAFLHALTTKMGSGLGY